MLRTVFAIEVAVLYAVILPGVSHVRHLDVVGYRVQFTNYKQLKTNTGFVFTLYLRIILQW